jgi:hypothetical protein
MGELPNRDRPRAHGAIELRREIDPSLRHAVNDGFASVGAEIASRLSAGPDAGGLCRADWALRFVSLDGKPFSFARHEYLRGIYECASPQIVIEKAAQTGGSVFAIADVLWALDTRRVRTAVYYFPTSRDVEDFSRDRFAPMIASCPRLAARARGVDNVHYKQFVGACGEVEGALYLRGMKSKVSTASVPADLVVIDERDKASSADYELALKRLSHSEHAILREVCTPSICDYGIDAAFERSDMRFWSIRCASCGTENQPEKTFREDGGPHRVLYEKGGAVYLGCCRCATPLDPAAGRWAADYPGREVAGFHLSQLYSQVVQRGKPVQAAILEDFRTTRSPAEFWNLRIGFPYEDRTTSLAPETLNACDGDYAPAASGTACTMGVDQGNEMHVVVSEWQANMRRVVWAGVIGRFERLHGLMREYDVRACVIDALPNAHSAREFAEAFPGRVFLCYYSRGAKGGPVWNAESRTVSVDRTSALDAAAASYLRRETRLPRHPLIEDVFKPQMGNLARRPMRDAAGEIVGYEWVRRGPDHFRHADCYDQLAGSRRSRGLESILAGVFTEGERVGAPPTEKPQPPVDSSDGDLPFSAREDMEKW